eukprot:g300.t1
MARPYAQAIHISATAALWEVAMQIAPLQVVSSSSRMDQIQVMPNEIRYTGVWVLVKIPMIEIALISKRAAMRCSR